MKENYISYYIKTKLFIFDQSSYDNTIGLYNHIIRKEIYYQCNVPHKLQGRIVSLCDDNSLHLWEINESSVVETKSLSLEGKLKKISAMCLESSGEHLLLGTEGGNIYLLNLKTFVVPDNIIYQDVVMQK